MGLEKKMDAIILAAGYGTRLRPLTENKPKSLLEVGNKTIMDYLINHLEQIPELEKIYVVSNAKLKVNGDSFELFGKNVFQLTFNEYGKGFSTSLYLTSIICSPEVIYSSNPSIFIGSFSPAS